MEKQTASHTFTKGMSYLVFDWRNQPVGECKCIANPEHDEGDDRLMFEFNGEPHGTSHDESDHQQAGGKDGQPAVYFTRETATIYDHERNAYYIFASAQPEQSNE